MSLERKLETAYAAVLSAYESGLGSTPVRLTSLLLDQAAETEPSDDAPEDVAQVPVPSVTLTAKRLEEALPDTGIFEAELTVEAADNARDGSDDAALDALFRTAARPLFYQTLTDTAEPPVTRNLFQALSNSASAFQVLGMPRRANGTEFEQSGSVARRKITAVFLCADLAA